MAALRLSPGTVKVAEYAFDLFGGARVHPGTWTGPVYVLDVTEEEAQVATELFAEIAVTAECIEDHEVPGY